MSMNNPERYSLFTHTIKRATDLLIEMNGKLSWNSGEMILDVGCANGAVTDNVIKKFAPKDATIIGADISEEMINYATKHHSHGNISYKLMDLADNNLWTTWQKEQFSKIFGFLIMHLIKNERKAYENIYDLLIPGGESLLMIPTEHFVDKLFPFLANLDKYKDYKEELSTLKFAVNPRANPLSYICEMLKSIGFDVVYSEKREYRPVIPTLDRFSEMIRLLPYLRKIIPSELFEEVVVDARKIAEDNNMLKKTENGYELFIVIMIIHIKKPN